MKKARGGKQTLLLLLLLTPTTRFVFCPLRVEGVCFPIPPSGCAQPLCLGTACLGQRQKWKDTNIRGKKKRRKNKTEKELLLQNFQPIKPRVGLLQESQVSQNPRPRGLKKWSQDLHPPCHRDPKGFGGAEHRHTAQQPVQAPRHTAPQASTSFLPLHFHRFVCVCVPQSPHIPARKAAFGPDGFSSATALPFGSRSQQHQFTEQHKAELGQGSSG